MDKKTNVRIDQENYTQKINTHPSKEIPNTTAHHEIVLKSDQGKLIELQDALQDPLATLERF